MAILKRDRSFQTIVSEINIKEIPIDYVQSVTLILENQDRVMFEGEDLAELDDENILNLIMGAADHLGEDYGSPVENIEIVINYSLLEQEVNTQTKKLLSKDSDDTSDTSM